MSYWKIAGYVASAVAGGAVGAAAHHYVTHRRCATAQRLPKGIYVSQSTATSPRRQPVSNLVAQSSPSDASLAEVQNVAVPADLEDDSTNLLAGLADLEDVTAVELSYSAEPQHSSEDFAAELLPRVTAGAQEQKPADGPHEASDSIGLSENEAAAQLPNAPVDATQPELEGAMAAPSTSDMRSLSPGDQESPPPYLVVDVESEDELSSTDEQLLPSGAQGDASNVLRYSRDELAKVIGLFVSRVDGRAPLPLDLWQQLLEIGINRADSELPEWTQHRSTATTGSKGGCAFDEATEPEELEPGRYRDAKELSTVDDELVRTTDLAGHAALYPRRSHRHNGTTYRRAADRAEIGAPSWEHHEYHCRSENREDAPQFESVEGSTNSYKIQLTDTAFQHANVRSTRSYHAEMTSADNRPVSGRLAAASWKLDCAEASVADSLREDMRQRAKWDELGRYRQRLRRTIGDAVMSSKGSPATKEYFRGLLRYSAAKREP